MFWNDPVLYGATFPYRDIPNPVQTPFAGPAFTPWQNIPRFVPPFYGFQPPFFNNFVNPYMQTPMHTPFVQPFAQPFFNFQPPQMNIPPFNFPQLKPPFACY